jgi:hypothetical protein
MKKLFENDKLNHIRVFGNEHTPFKLWSCSIISDVEFERNIVSTIRDILGYQKDLEENYVYLNKLLTEYDDLHSINSSTKWLKKYEPICYKNCCELNFK